MVGMAAGVGGFQEEEEVVSLIEEAVGFPEAPVAGGVAATTNGEQLRFSQNIQLTEAAFGHLLPRRVFVISNKLEM